MSNDAIRAALSAQMMRMYPALPIAWPNTAYAPTVDDPFMRVNFLPGQTANPSMVGSGNIDLKRHNGVMQVTLFYPTNTGEGELRRKADAVIAHFPRGSSYEADGVVVNIDFTPSASPAFSQGAWYVMPVSIYYRADVI